MRGLLRISAALSLAGCVDRGLDLKGPDPAALTFVAVIERGQVSVRRLGSTTTSEPFPLRSEGETHLLQVSRERLQQVVPAVDLARLDEVEPTLSATFDLDCREQGSLVRLDSSDGSRLDLLASELGTLYRLEGEGTATALVPVVDWPEQLLGWVLQVPMTTPCRSFDAEVLPFLATSPIVQFGEFLGAAQISTDFPQAANIHRIVYVDDDTALFSSNRALVLARRGQSLREAVVVDEELATFPPRPSEEHLWRFVDFALGELVGDRRPGYLLLHLHGPPLNEFSGAAIVQFTLTSTAIFAFERRHFEPPRAGELAETALRRVAVRPDRGFAAVGDGILITGPEHGDVTVGLRAELKGSFILFPPPPFPGSVIQDRAGGWWTGSVEFIDGLQRERGSGALGEVVGVTRLVEGPNGAALVSTNALPELYRREGPDDWRLHEWWLPVAASRCASDTTQCGRLVPRPAAGVRDFTSFEQGGEILHSFDECPFVFLTHPLENHCSRYLSIHWRDYILPGGERDEVIAIARRGDRVLIAGTEGLLLELTLPGHL